MGELSGWHWLIVIGVFVLLFGARKLPDAARSLGRSTRILKAELRADDAAPSPVTPPAPVQPQDTVQVTPQVTAPAAAPASSQPAPQTAAGPATDPARTDAT
ncbi:hypothetical protein GCM10009836_73650 [Pseudonocardia ailaonensis]|uniref:Sec-independent protein translocase protein TatA n=1 Tax=Pseudonocardia ailaonensis TaxID=367279 RepID=A0ABN2NPU7_9PSEU